MHPDNDPVVSVTPTEAPITELPALEDIAPNTQPLLYDFVAGCLDWHISIHRDTIDSDFYLLRHKSNPSLIWTDWYIIQGGGLEQSLAVTAASGCFWLCREAWPRGLLCTGMSRNPVPGKRLTPAAVPLPL